MATFSGRGSPRYDANNAIQGLSIANSTDTTEDWRNVRVQHARHQAALCWPPMRTSHALHDAGNSEGWVALLSSVVGEDRAIYRAVVDADLEGIVAKHLADAYQPKLVRWHKILNRAYSQRRGRAEWFLDRRGLPARQR